MALSKAFLGHSIFTEFSVQNALTRFQDYGAPQGAPPPTDAQRIDRFIQALQDLQIGSVFIQLFTRSGDVETNDANQNLRKELTGALVQAGINWAGWGYCAGSNWNRDEGLVTQFQDALSMPAFMIDAEPGNKINGVADIWAQSDFDAFTDYLQQKVGTDNLTLTTWPVLQMQNDPAHNVPLVTLMKIAAPRIGAFVPQAYWMNHPSQAYYNLGFSQQDYPPNDPVSFVRLCVKSWSMLGFTTPLIVAGQTYWSASDSTPPMATMNTKVADFTTTFADWPQIVGFSWYHAGMNNSTQTGAMSDAMINAIKQGKLGAKPYQPQSGPAPG
jgi:hypothetical protein